MWSIRHFIPLDFPIAVRVCFAKALPSRDVAEQLGNADLSLTVAQASSRPIAEWIPRSGRLPHTICYAVKANSNLGILRVFAELGSGFDIVSGGELYRLRRIGVPGDRIVFSGVGKSREEIREALRARILLFNVESPAELDLLARRKRRAFDCEPQPRSASIRQMFEAGGSSAHLHRTPSPQIRHRLERGAKSVCRASRFPMD